MKKIISLLLVLVTILSMTVLAGCGEVSINDENLDDEKLSDEERLVGTWKCDDDIGNKFIKSMKKDQDNPLSEYMPENKELIVEMTAKFTEDGEFELTVPDGTNDLVETFFREVLHESYTPYISDLAKENSMTVNQVLSANGVSSIDELVEAVIIEADIDFNDMVLSKSGDYTVKGEKIYTSEDKSEYYTYTLDDDTLTLTGSEDEDDADKYPRIFKRQK